MKRILLAIFLTGIMGNGPASTVYVCSGSNAKSYHLKENCRGLSSCQHKISKLSLNEAQKDGKTLCGWEK